MEPLYQAFIAQIDLLEELQAFIHGVPRAVSIEPEPIECTGYAASWCPICGDCTCPRDPRTAEVESCSEACPLHGSRSKHTLSAG